jgi:hypothetical protein
MPRVGLNFLLGEIMTTRRKAVKWWRGLPKIKRLGFAVKHKTVIEKTRQIEKIYLYENNI